MRCGYIKWNLLKVSKNVIRHYMQLAFQLKNFTEVDTI